MAQTALALYVLWATFAFGVRSWLHHRRTDDRGLRLHANPRTAAWWAKVGFIVAIAVGVAAPIASLAGLPDLSFVHSPAVQISGLVIALIGALITVWVQEAMGTSWRVGVDPHERTDLVIHGPFKYSRNPIFAAMIITALGLTLMVPNVVSLIGRSALVAAIELQVRMVEEPYLRSMHAQSYIDYERHVARFFPRKMATPPSVNSTSCSLNDVTFIGDQ